MDQSAEDKADSSNEPSYQEFRKFSPTELKTHLEQQPAGRTRLQGEINRLNREREHWLTGQKMNPTHPDATLVKAMTTAAREQALV